MNIQSLSAVVVAAGRSVRFNSSLKGSSGAVSKQLIAWNNKPLLIHTLDALFHLSLNECAVVIRPEEREEIEAEIYKQAYRDRVLLAYGGTRRQDSVRSGLSALAGVDRVLVHDGARPFLSPSFLEELDRQSRNVDGLIPVVPVVETLKQIDQEGWVVATRDRNCFVRVQTPQFFKMGILRDVHSQWKDSTIEFTDDAAMLERSGFRVKTCAGLPENIKVTVSDDLRHLGLFPGVFHA